MTARISRLAKSYVVSLVVACLLFLSAARPASAAEQVRFIVTDLEGLEEVQREFGAFRDLIERETGLDMKFYPVSNRTAAVEAIRARKAELILTGPAEYVVIRKMTNARPIMAFSRPDYYCSIVVRADSGINRITDLKGKKVSFEDVGSTSNHLAPSQVMKDAGLDPTRDIEAVFTSNEIAWEALKKGDIAAWATNHDDYRELRARETEMPPGAFKVIGRGPDLPNDVLVAGRHTSNGVISKIRRAITDNSDALIRAILKGEENAKYEGMMFLPTVKDADYDYVREMYAAIGKPQFARK